MEDRSSVKSMQEAPSSPGAAILIVDDDAMVRRSLQAILEHAGHICRCAADGVEGLGMLRAEDCDVALIDMHMPRLDGLGLLAGMRQTQVQAVPLVLTGFGEVASAVEAMKLGAFDYLTKPPDYQELTRATARAIEHSRTRRRARIMEELAAQWEATFDACPRSNSWVNLSRKFSATTPTSSPCLIQPLTHLKP